MPMPKPLRDYPERGSIYIANLDPSFGREIHKKRPVLIVSNDLFNKNTPYVVIVPSSSIVPSVIPEGMVGLGKLRGLKRRSVLLPLFIRSIDKDRLVRKVGRLSKAKMFQADEALKLVLGMLQENNATIS